MGFRFNRLPAMSRSRWSEEDVPGMKVLYLLHSSSTESGRAVTGRSMSDLLPKLNTSPDVDLMIRTLIAEGDLHQWLSGIGLRAGTIAGDPWLRLPGGVWRLAMLLKREGFDVVHASEPIPANAAGIAKRIARSPAALVYFRHHEFGRRRLQVASRMAGRLSDVTFVHSQVVASRAVELDRTDPHAVRVVRPGVAEVRAVGSEEIYDARRRMGIPREAPVVGAVARVRPEKGLVHLVDAMTKLSDLRPMPHLVVAGDGSQLEDVSRRAAQALGSRAHFVGHQDDVALWFAVADVVAIPSLREGFGLAALEAMASGRPIVASDVGGLAEAVGTDGCALLVSPADPVGLETSLRILLKDDSLRYQMGLAARERYEDNFTLDHMAASMTDAWRWAALRSRSN